MDRGEQHCNSRSCSVRRWTQLTCVNLIYVLLSCIHLPSKLQSSFSYDLKFNEIIFSYIIVILAPYTRQCKIVRNEVFSVKFPISSSQPNNQRKITDSYYSYSLSPIV